MYRQFRITTRVWYSNAAASKTIRESRSETSFLPMPGIAKRPCSCPAFPFSPEPILTQTCSLGNVSKKGPPHICRDPLCCSGGRPPAGADCYNIFSVASDRRQAVCPHPTRDSPRTAPCRTAPGDRSRPGILPARGNPAAGSGKRQPPGTPDC